MSLPAFIRRSIKSGDGVGLSAEALTELGADALPEAEIVLSAYGGAGASAPEAETLFPTLGEAVAAISGWIELKGFGAGEGSEELP
jgi:hypothetical protein